MTVRGGAGNRNRCTDDGVTLFRPLVGMCRFCQLQA